MDKLKAISESNLDIIVDLRSTIGADKTVALVEIFGGTQMYIPQLTTILKSERDRAVCSDFEAGLTYREISLKYSLASATVREIINKERKVKR